ncbi:MAG TPA: ABC transporter ATP-binding protein [Trebonia sp.]|nr:ABC transporter ATP-binding protein [Trebonia sp.]
MTAEQASAHTADTETAETSEAVAGQAEAAPVLSVDRMAVSYRTRRGPRGQRLIRAVDDVSFDIGTGEILALVGESGCGKTSIAKAITRLEEPAGGRVLFRGQDVAHVQGRALRALRKDIQMVFQDPFESLDPRLNAGDTVAEPLIVHGLPRPREKVLAALEQVGLHPGATMAGRYPHQMSGGQRQRLVIAAAMVLEPSLVIADEPVSMLDVSLRAGILRLMLDLRDSRGVSFLFVTHDLSLAWVVADRIAVVYLGRIVEIGAATEVIKNPRHPYTQALVSVIPVPETVPAGAARRERVLLTGEAPSAARIPSGCRFHPRCPLYRTLGEPEQCRTADPAPLPVTRTHQAACHFTKEP